MASQLDDLATRPKWQLAIIWALISGLIGVGWYYMYFEDAIKDNEQAAADVRKQSAELARMKERLANFEQEMAQAKAMEQELEEKKRKLPLSSATIDHLMRKFQQQGRLVGVSIENWTPSPEQKLDFYAKMPVDITARGSWLQFGEFFRRVSEMEQIVNIEGVGMELEKSADEDRIVLDVRFMASTFRFLDESERSKSVGSQGNRSRNKKGSK
ncbi:MAG: type 4a pilus biogenesis protein PilO [Nannocystaceae bacterium]